MLKKLNFFFFFTFILNKTLLRIIFKYYYSFLIITKKKVSFYKDVNIHIFITYTKIVFLNKKKLFMILS